VAAIAVAPLSQRDPRWAGLPLGTSQVSIGEAGCLLCCAAMVHNYFGGALTPAQLNAALVAAGGYADGNRFVWAALERISRLWLVPPDAPLVGPPYMPFLRILLAMRLPVICHVDSRPDMAGVQDHYVLLIGEHQYADPWDGMIRRMEAPETQVLALAAYAPVRWATTPPAADCT